MTYIFISPVKNVFCTQEWQDRKRIFNRSLQAFQILDTKIFLSFKH